MTLKNHSSSILPQASSFPAASAVPSSEAAKTVAAADLAAVNADGSEETVDESSSQVSPLWPRIWSFSAAKSFVPNLDFAFDPGCCFLGAE